MKPIIPLFLILIVISSCKDDEVIPTGPIVQKERSISNYTGIDIRNGLLAFISMDTGESVIVETNQNLQQYIHSFKEGNVLVIQRDASVDFPSGTVVNVYISAKSLNTLKASGGSNISETDSIPFTNFSLEISGGSLLEASLYGGSVTANISGGSNIMLAGTTDSYHLTSSGGSLCNGFDFISNTLNCDVSGGGNLNITVNQTLDVIASGGSIVNYKGNGTVNTSDLSGGSQINHLP